MFNFRVMAPDDWILLEVVDDKSEKNTYGLFTKFMHVASYIKRYSTEFTHISRLAIDGQRVASNHAWHLE